MATTTAIEVPLYTDLKYRYGIALEGQSYQFTFYWNERCSQWHMDLRLENQTPILLGYALVPQYPMTIDYNLEDVGLTGYFMLLPVSATISNKISEESSIMPQFFSLFYIYEQE